MLHFEFQVGHAFSVSRRSLWLCTDIGSHTIIAVRLDATEVVTRTYRNGQQVGEAVSTVDPRRDRSWLNGPPYALAQTVFDAYDLPACEPVAEEAVPDWVPDPSWPPPIEGEQLEWLKGLAAKRRETKRKL